MLWTAAHVLGMAQKRQRRRWFLREWRRYRNLSQEALASRIGKTQGLISQLERNQTSYTGDLLEALADALMCEPADLLIRNPTDPNAPWSIWDTLPPTERNVALSFMRNLKRAAEG